MNQQPQPPVNPGKTAADVTVELIHPPTDIKLMLWDIWGASKYDGVWPAPRDRSDLDRLFWDLWDADVPVMESVHLSFVIDNVPVAWREQAVRHRVGHYFGPTYAMGAVPDLAHSSFWAQSMRVQDLSSFADNGQFFVPDTIESGPGADDMPDDATSRRLRKEWSLAMHNAQTTYRRLLACGVPEEDARGVIPLYATTRLTWTTNLKALRHVLAKRSCWILQLSLWEPVVRGMIAELRKLDPLFGDACLPPCFRRGAFKECTFQKENEDRLEHHDPNPPCPLYLFHTLGTGGRNAVEERVQAWAERGNGHASLRWFHRRTAAYAAFWGRDPYTGNR